jgi:hypothetical protein
MCVVCICDWQRTAGRSACMVEQSQSIDEENHQDSTEIATVDLRASD